MFVNYIYWIFLRFRRVILWTTGRGEKSFSVRGNCPSNMKFWLISCFEQVDRFFKAQQRLKKKKKKRKVYMILTFYLEFITSFEKCWNVGLESLKHMDMTWYITLFCFANTPERLPPSEICRLILWKKFEAHPYRFFAKLWHDVWAGAPSLVCGYSLLQPRDTGIKKQVEYAYPVLIEL